MTSLPGSLAWGALRDAALALVVAGALAGAVSAVESSEAGAFGVLVSLAPVALGGATGHRFARARIEGQLAGWQGLGRSPLALLMPACVLGGGLAVLCLLWPLPTAAVALPAPVDAGLGAWWADGWVGLPAARWTVPPGELDLFALAGRWWEGAPRGARPGTDGAELLRRLSLATSWPLAVGLSGWLALVRRAEPPRAALQGALIAAAWLFAGALAVGAYSMT